VRNVYQIAGRRPRISREMHVLLEAACRRARDLDEMCVLQKCAQRWALPRGVKSELREIRRAVRLLAPSAAERDRLLASTRSWS
jgi:hypothetical protein